MTIGKLPTGPRSGKTEIVRQRQITIPDAKAPIDPAAGTITPSTAQVQKGTSEIAAKVTKTSAPVFFPTTGTASALLQLDLQPPKSHPPKPAERETTYLIINSTSIQDAETSQAIAAEIKLLLGSQEFLIILDQNNNLVIMSFAERAGINMLLDIAASIQRFNERSSMYLGRGKISYPQEQHGEGFQIDTFPDYKAQKSLLEGEPGTYLARDLHERIKDTESRIGSTVNISVTDEGREGTVRLLEHKSHVRLKGGGPDRLIGYEGEQKALTDNLTDETTKVIMLKGPAGMGKSRLLKETLPKHPSVVLCSLAPEDRNVVGSGLATLAKQLAEIIQADEKLDLAQVDQAVINHVHTPGQTTRRETSLRTTNLQMFIRLSHADQIKLAAKNPQAIADLCYNALRMIHDKRATNTVFVLEDLHHADRISEPFLTATAERYAQGTQGKALISMRPEESHQSTAQRGLVKRLPKGQLQTISLEKGLDFSNPEISHDFVYYTLPTGMRTEKKLGDWHKKLGTIARNSPFVMKTLVDSAIEQDAKTRAYAHLIWAGKTIDVEDNFLRQIATINPSSESDIANYFHERVAMLPETAREALQCLALIGGKAGRSGMGQIMKMIMGEKFSNEELISVHTTLIDGGFIIKEGDSYVLQHETILAIVLGSMRDQQRKQTMARDLYARLKPSLRNLQKHRLLMALASTDIDLDHVYELLTATRNCLEEARNKNDHELEHQIATSTLSTPCVQDTINRAMRAKEPVFRLPHVQLAVTALMAEAKSGRFIGKFAAVDDATAKLMAIYKNHPGDVEIRRVHIARFEKAYLTASPREMEAIFTKDLENGAGLQALEKLVLEIKLAYRKGDHKRVIELYNENKAKLEKWDFNYRKQNSMPHPEYVEIMRMVRARAPFTSIRQNLINPHPGIALDEDTLLSPHSTLPEQHDQLETIEKALQEIQTLAQRYPLILNPVSELAINQQRAEVAALLGEFDRASEMLAENWRICMQMGLHSTALRAAKIRGDILICQATAADSPENFNREKILEAIRAYSEEGLTAADKIDNRDNFYKMALRIQRIRAIGILIISHPPATLPHLISTALDDLEYLGQNFADKAKLAEVNYYLLGYVGHLIRFAAQLKTPRALEIAKKSPFINTTNITAAREFSKTMEDHGQGEIQRKLAGLNILEELQ